jgi:hypothetical protein
VHARDGFCDRQAEAMALRRAIPAAVGAVAALEQGWQHSRGEI